MKKTVLFLAVMGFSLACDYIDNPIQGSIGPIGPCDIPKQQFYGDSINRNALIEDFTGHRCNNCPKASDAIKAINQSLPGTTVDVAVHAGAANFTAPDPPDYPTDFRTPEGEEMKDFFSVTFNPAGMVSRQDFSAQGAHLKLYPSWSGLVSAISNESAPLAIDLQVGYDSTSRQLCGNAKLRFFSNQTDALNVSFWLCESKIIAPQKMPDNSKNPTYEHNNVFRYALNTTFGQEVSAGGVMDGDAFEIAFDTTIDTAYVAKHCKLVAFVFNRETQEVLQAEEVALENL